MFVFGCIFFLSSVLYSQILLPADIDIYIDGNQEIMETLGKIFVEQGIDRTWDDYYYQMKKVTECFLKPSIGSKGIEGDEFITLKMEYQKLLEMKTPRKLQHAFKTIGWDSDGQQKFMTITFGFIMLMPEEVEASDAEILLNLFDKDDMAIIKARLNELMKL